MTARRTACGCPLVWVLEEPPVLYISLYIWTGKAVGAEVLSTIVGFLCRVPSVRNEEIALFSQQMTFWRGVGFSRGDCISKPDHAQLKESCGGREGLRI
jgi:hypothetical protein